MQISTLPDFKFQVAEDQDLLNFKLKSRGESRFASTFPGVLSPKASIKVEEKSRLSPIFNLDNRDETISSILTFC